MIQLHNINKSYFIDNKELRVLKNINFSIEAGEFIAIVGKSGSGKSTLLNVLGMLDKFDSGEYVFNQTNIRKLTDNELSHFRNTSIGFVFQSFHLLPYKTALDNVSVPLVYQNITSKERILRATTMLTQLGLQDRLDHFPSQLSGGQKQRVAIARALITKPNLILADEPTGALDSNTSKDILNLLKQIHQQGTTVIIVTHDNEIANQCNRKIIIADGEIIKN